jgi:hypothetical protein
LAGTYGGTGNGPGAVRLTPGNYYEIQGRVDIGVDRGANGAGGAAASLTIDPGVTLFGNDASDILIINRGSQVFVNGTSTSPVIMTSLQDITRASVLPTANRERRSMRVPKRAKAKLKA